MDHIDISRIALYMSVDFWTLDSPATTKYKKDTDMPISSSPFSSHQGSRYLSYP